MSQANIYGFPNAKAHAPRNAFGMSHDTLFNSPVGMLLPAFLMEVKAGDKVKSSVKTFTRTNHVNTAAFMAFEQKLDMWFVPCRLLWSAYNQWRLGNTQARSTTSLYDVSRLEHMPHAKWLDFLVKGPDGVYSFAWSIFKSGKYAYNVDKFTAMCRFLDLFGYGLLPIQNVTDFEKVDRLTTHQNDTLVSYFKLLDENYNFNWMRLASYQCVYMHAYRNKDYEELDPSYYNCDSLFLSKVTFDNGEVNVDGSTSYHDDTSTPYHLYHGLSGNAELVKKNHNRLTLDKLFTPRYKNQRRDLFTTMKPSNGITQLWSATGNFPSTDVVIPPTNNENVNGNPDKGRPYVPSITQGVTAQSVRNLMALDKFARLAVYADKDYSSLYEALFGVKVDEPDVPRYLGSFSTKVEISEVVATAAGSDQDADNTATSVLGQLAGKGIGSGSNSLFKGEFKEDGIIIGIHYIMPYNYYNPYKIDPFNTKSSRYDYYYPSFDGLGLSPVYLSEYSYWFGFGGAINNGTMPATLLGYNTRYHEYKQKQNTVHGTFAPAQSESHWTLTLNDDRSVNPQFLYKINPTCTDSIFGVNWNGAPVTDPFKCFYSFDVMKVSDMEAIGIPNT